MTDTSSQHTSPSLLARVKSDDALAWRQLVELYGPLVIQWCRRKGLNGDDGADVRGFFLATKGTKDTNFFLCVIRVFSLPKPLRKKRE